MHKERQQCNELWYTQHSDATLKILPHLLYLSLFSLLKHFKSNFRHCIISPLHISCSVATKCLVHPHSLLFPFQGHSERFCDILLYVLDLLCSANWFFPFLYYSHRHALDHMVQEDMNQEMRLHYLRRMPPNSHIK